MKTKADVRKRKKNFISVVEFIANKAVDSTLSNQFMKSVKESADELSGFLGCTRMQSVLFSVICNLNFSNKSVGLEQIATWLGCNPIEVANYMNEIENLRKNKILRKEAEDKKIDNINSISAISFSVNPDVFNALRKGEPLSQPKSGIKDSYELIKAISGLIEQRTEDVITFNEMWQEIARIESKYSKMEFLKELKRLVSDKKERILFINLCDEYFAGNLNCDLIPKIRVITPDEREQLEIRFKIGNGNSQLISKVLIEIREGFFRSEKEIRLTSKAVEMLTKDNKKMIIGIKEKKSPDFILSKEIKEKTMFFTPAEQDKIDFLAKLLMPGPYRGLTKRLDKSGMKTGVAVLFYGPPGTGKTESVLQLARQAGRDIFQVTISETKSKWFGESEKRIKDVFDRYRKLAEESKIIPILFFNEADGIFSTRKQIGDSNVDQTENAIQNIILQEMEDMKGILIATTNMTQNFDKAFDRRFLYKIQFEKPSAEARSHIWKDKIPSLTDVTALRLAETHDLSGGQIDNVARKYLMSRILQAKIPTHQQVESWCQEENTRQETKKIGYKL